MDTSIRAPDEAPTSGCDTVPEQIRAEAAELARGAEVLPDGVDSLARRIWSARQQGRQLRVKLGVDPTGSQLHLGHTVVLRRLRRFQDFGHQGVLIIGGFTARIGDPTGRNAARPALDASAVAANASSFLDQVRGILRMDTLEVRNNADWLGCMDLTAIIQLASRTTVNRLIAKEQFGQRLEQHQPVGLHELFYPLLQGHDSVVVQADVEIGGTDQRFNILQGRELQQQMGTEPQIALMLPILEGTDGKRKMSKTFDNAINLNDSAEDVFAKTMRLPDALLVKFFELATGLSGQEVEQIRSALAAGENPMQLKLRLGRQLVLELHGESAAGRVHDEWVSVHCRGEAPADMPSHAVTAGASLVSVLVSTGIATSNSKARELIRAGAVSLDGTKVQDQTFTLSVPAGSSIILKAGKRHFIRLSPQAVGRSKEMPRTLLIDDLKNIPADRVARNYAEGIAALQEERWDVLLLDHDLGDFSGPEGRELDGCSIMYWLEQNQQHLPGEVIIVSRNPIGRERINGVLRRLYGGR